MVYDIVTIGDSVRDIFIKPHSVDTERKKFGEVNICFEHGSKISIDEVHYDIGGSACNVAVGLSRLGYQTAVIGATGEDQNAEKIHERLISENVDDIMLKSFTKIETNFSVIIVYKGERTVLVYRGLKDYSQIKIPKKIGTKWIYLGPVANSFQANYRDIIRLVSEKNVNLAINPGHRQIVEGKDALKRLIYVSKIVILNKSEAVDLTGMPHYAKPKELLRRLKNYGAEIVVITDGEKGAFAVTNDDYIGIKGYPTDVVDNTGAGDAFSSGFLASYVKNNDLNEALKWGVMNSSEVLKKFGAQTNLPNTERLKNIIKYAPDVYNI